MIAFVACLAILAAAIVILLVARARFQRAGGSFAERSVHDPLMLALLSIVVLVGPGMAVLGLLPPVQWLFHDVACPPGWHLIATSSAYHGGTSHGVACQQGNSLQALSAFFRVACAALVAALAASVGLYLMLRRWLVERERKSWTSAS